MKVAAVQFAPLLKEPEKNLETAVALVRQAAAGGAHLVVLPELCLSGYSFMSSEEAGPFGEILTRDPGVRKRSAGDGRSKSMDVLPSLAAELGVAIAWGLIEEDPGTGHLYNAQILVLPTSEWVSYRKVNPFGNDFLWSKPGTGSPPIIKFMGKQIGLLICADVRDKSDNIGDFYEKGDADIVAYSANWGDGGYPASKWMTFARDNGCTLVVSNRYGREENNNFGEGGIGVIEPTGKVHCKGLLWSQPCVVYAEVP